MQRKNNYKKISTPVRRVPPQKLSVTAHGDAQKTFQVAAISVTLVILLAAFLFFATPFFGKAIAGIGGSSVDFSFISPDTLQLVFTPDNQGINGLYLELASATTSFDLCDTANQVLVASIVEDSPNYPLDWETVEARCENGKFIWGAATLDDTKVVDTPITVTFTLQKPGLPQTFSVVLNSFASYETAASEDLFSVVFPSGVTANQPPTAVLQATYTGTDLEVTLSASGSTDADGDALTYTYNFGDGTPAAVITTSSTSVSYTYAEAGSYAQQLLVSDGKGGAARAVQTVLVQLQQPAGQALQSCLESWGCGNWNACQNNVQTRICTDANACGTIAQKPTERQGCTLPLCGDGNRELPEECDDGNIVNEDGCTTLCRIEVAGGQVQQQPAQPGGSTSASGSGSSGGSGGGGGLSCVRKWECGDWGQCSNARQTRTCNDLHACNSTKTFRNKTFPVFVIDKNPPNVTQSCVGGIVVPSVPSVTQQKPVTAPPAVKVPAPISVSQSVSAWKALPLWLIITVPLLFAVVVVFLFLWLHAHRKKQTVYNFDELKEWISKEKKAGASEEEIVGTLREHTHWKLDEIRKMFGEIGQSSSSG